MGGYLDFSFKQLCDLTRERRRERLVAVSMRAEPDLAQIERACIRVHGEGYEFKARIAELMGSGRRKSAASVWRRAQWKIGNRRCHYCRCPLEKPPKAGGHAHPRSATTDHRQPLARDGADDASNWAMCCWDCNQRKGSLTEAEFAAVREGERLRLTG